MQQERKSAEEILGIPAQRRSAEEILGLTPQSPQESTYQRLKRQLGLGLEMLGQKVSDAAVSAAELGGAAISGDYRPIMEAGERTIRGALTLASAFDPVNAETTYPAVAAEQAGGIQDVKQRQAVRRDAQGDVYFKGSAIENARLEAEAAKDPSLPGRIVRALPQALPYVATGILSGGSVPALAATGAVMDLDEPENIPLSAGLSAVPLPAVGQTVRIGANAIRRVLGRGAEQIVEAETRSAPGVVTGAVEDMARIRANALQNSIDEGVKEIPRSTLQRVGSEAKAILALPRAIMASADVSAPLRQGALLTLPPSQWGRAAHAGVRMFQAFSTKRFEKIAQEIGSHPDSQLAQNFGLHLSTQAKEGLRRAEEDFVSKYAGRIPIVKHSEQAYSTYLDSLRIDTFAKYRRLIDAQDFTPAQREIAYAGAADWINVATGRGSFGQTIDRAMEPLGQILFAPRYLASRFNVLNPVMYARNAATPEGRVILKQQMSELMQFAGVTASTMALAKAAGADVNLSPSSPDFLKIRAGRFSYDPLAGLQQVMRLVYRTGIDLTRAVLGDKSEQGENTLDLAGRFLRSKLAPVPSFFVDFASRRTFTGEPFDPAKGAVERIMPIMWNDWLSAYQQEGWKGIAAVSPALAGVGVQNYEPDPIDAAMERARPLLSELVRLNRSVPEIRRVQNEDDSAFNARVKVFGEALETYGMRLVASDEYKRATDEHKRKALDLLPRRISGALMKQGEAWLLEPRLIMSDVAERRQ